MKPNVELTGAAQPHRAASELSAGLERMIREAGWSGIYTQWTSPTERESMTVPVTPEQVARFAELVVAAERERVLDGIDECPGLTMAQDKWLSDMVRSNV